MKSLLLGVIGMAGFLLICSHAQADFYSYANGDLYLVTDTKAYKVEIVGNKWYTTNHWFPLDQYGYTEEHVQKIKERQARHANRFIKENRQYSQNKGN